jgi:CDP-glucose 4,6-dehydratase
VAAGQRPLEDLVSAGHWLDRPVLVTGATGLLGGWLLKRLLASRANVVCLVRDWVPQSEAVRSGALDQVTVVRGDICDLEILDRTLAEYEIDTVFHLAAQTIVGVANRSPISTFETNVRGTWLLLDACRRSPLVRAVVVASSDKAYGEHEVLPYSEDAPLIGRHPYDVSKSCTDLIAQAFATTYGTPVAITRCGNFYGGGDLNWNRVVPGTIRSAIRGTAPVIRSNGKPIRDYFYVEDGAAANMHLAQRLHAHPELAGEAFNFSNSAQVTVSEIVALILEQLGRSDLEPIVQDDAPNEIQAQYLDPSKAQRVLGWNPEFDLTRGLERTTEWYRAFLGAHVG